MEQKIDLDTSRLLISTSLGNEFAGLLEQDSVITEISDLRVLKRVEKELSKLSSGKRFLDYLENVVDGTRLVAKALREVGTEPSLIHGVNIANLPDPSVKAALEVIERSVGSYNGAGMYAVCDRIFDKNFCFITLGFRNIHMGEEKELMQNLKILSKAAGIIIVD